MICPQKTRFIFSFGVLYLLSTDLSHSWDLTSLNITDDSLISKYTVWRNRAFLAIPRTANEGKEEYRPTLMEVPWPEVNHRLPMSVINTVTLSRSKNRPSKHNYEAFAYVTGLDIDARGRLWILDASDESNRWPRIVVYDLKRNDRLVSFTSLIDISPKHLKSLVVDSFEDQWGPCGYIADAGDETIIVYSLGRDMWWKLRLSHGPELPRVYPTDLAICRENSILYMTGRDTDDLFSISLEKIRTSGMFKTMPLREGYNVTVNWLGKKLGSSTGLFCDSKDGLHYFIISERASVRWDTRLPLNAESHSILVQSTDVPCVTDYAMDARRYVWGLVNPECPGVRKKKKTSSKSRLKFRTVRLPK